ncbi:MAG: 2,3-bisphosphoglycerate-dependent phosphoglycerate mutase [Janthinobacterium lividum]
MLPRGASLADTQARVVALWQDTVVPALAQGENVLMIGHGNSLRVLMKHLEGLSDEAIVDLDVPNGVPFVYRLDAAFKPLRKEQVAVAHETHGNIL